MPLDSSNWTDTRTRKELFWASEPRERLRMLAEDLRGEMKDWQWFFTTTSNHCRSVGCALGWADKMYGIRGEDDPCSGGYFVAAECAFGIDYDTAESIFAWQDRMGDPTPIALADAITEYLATARLANGRAAAQVAD